MDVGDTVTVMISRVSGGESGTTADRIGITLRRGKKRIAVELSAANFGMAVTGVLVEGKVTGGDYR